MALPRTEVTTGLLEELERFKGLVQALTPAEWATPSRCSGWTVGDVAAHVVGGMADVAALRLEGLGTPEVTARQVAERHGRSPGEIADELGATIKATADLLGAFDDAAWAMPSPGGFDMTLGEGVEALWHDAWLHGEDIRSALGRPSDRGERHDGQRLPHRRRPQPGRVGPRRPRPRRAAGVLRERRRQRQPAARGSPATRWRSCWPPPAGPTRARSGSTKAPTSTGDRRPLIIGGRARARS